MRGISFNEFCEKFCDRLYDPRIEFENQSTGYKLLRKMVINGNTPASIEEMLRWEKSPTTDELFCKPDIKYLRFLHPILREYVVSNWSYIKDMQVD